MKFTARLSMLLSATICTSLLVPALAMTATAVPEGPLAAIGGQPVTLDELGPETAAKLAKINRSYERRKTELETSRLTNTRDTLAEDAQAYIDRQVLEREAQATGQTAEALLGQVPVPAVTSDEVHRVYTLNARILAQPLASVESALRAQLKRDHEQAARRAYLAALRAKYDARNLVEPVRLKVADTGPARGPPNASVTIVMFSDFECPYCQRVMPALEQTLDAYPDQVRLVHRHLPLTSLHPHALAAARASVCAERQGEFWPFLAAAFADTKPLEDAELHALAKSVKLDEAALQACLSGSEPQQRVDADIAAADSLGLSSTPSLLIHGRLIRGAVPASALAEVIDDEIARRAGH